MVDAPWIAYLGIACQKYTKPIIVVKQIVTSVMIKTFAQCDDNQWCEHIKFDIICDLPPIYCEHIKFVTRLPSHTISFSIVTKT